MALGSQNTEGPLGSEIDYAELSPAAVAAIQALIDNAIGGIPGDAVTSVNSETGAVTLDADDISDAATTKKFTTASDISKLAGIETGADVTDATNVNAAGAVMESDYDAQTILRATLDNTPTALTVDEQTLVGRKTGGNITALTSTEGKVLLGLSPTDSPNFDSVGLKDQAPTAHFLKLQANSALEFSEDRTLTIAMPDTNNTLTINSSAALNQDVQSTASPSFSNININNGGALRTGTSSGNTLKLQARDVDGASWTDMLTITAGNTPTLNLADGSTHNNLPLPSEGTYTPTYTNVANVASFGTVSDLSWQRIGNRVYIGGRLSVDPTAGSVNTEFRISMPPGITSNFSLFTDAWGSCIALDGVSISAGARADTVNDRVLIKYVNTSDVGAKEMSLDICFRVI